MRNKKIIRSATISMSTIFYNPIVKDLQAKGFDVVSVTSPGPELTELSEMGVRCIEVPMERHISLSKDLKSLINLIRVFRKEKPAMVHSMTPKAGLLCMIAAWICRVPRRVHTFTGLIWPTATGLSRKILMFTDWLTCSCATHVIPEGKGVMNDLQSHITHKSMKVLGYGNVKGVDMDYWKVTDNLKNKSKTLRDSFRLTPKSEGEKIFSFIFVGRLVGDKGINELVDAFLRLREYYLHKNNGQKVRLVLVGPLEDELDPLKQVTWDRIKTTPSIIEVGPVWGDDILKYYAACDCFAFPSYREGFPNTVLEAGAMGLPSIVTDVNGSREIIENGKNGVIIPPKNADALFEAMKQMIEDKEGYKTMAINARPMIESRFEQSFVRKCLLDFYDEIM